MDNEEVKDIKQEFGSHEKMNTFAKGVNENYTGSAPDNADVVFGLKDIWNKIIELNPNGEYLFENHGKRIRGNTFNKRLSTICDKLDIPRRSMHKIRKTYATTLIDKKVSESFIQEQMGHSDITTTRKLYYFSNEFEEEKYKQIEEAISF